MKNAVLPQKLHLGTRRGGGWLFTGLKHILLMAAGLLALYPVYYMVVTAFKTREGWLHNQFSLPIPFTLDNFGQALNQGRLLVWFTNSVIVTVASILA
jgi:raffinose/stachyose/melibiose transport system permease protein